MQYVRSRTPWEVDWLVSCCRCCFVVQQASHYLGWKRLEKLSLKSWGKAEVGGASLHRESASRGSKTMLLLVLP